MKSRPRTIKATVPAPGRPKRTPRAPALLVLHGDGYVELYGDGLDVLVVHALTVEPFEEATADEILTDSLPLRFRELHYPAKLLVAAQSERRTPAEELSRRAAVEFVRDCVALWQERPPR